MTTQNLTITPDPQPYDNREIVFSGPDVTGHIFVRMVTEWHGQYAAKVTLSPVVTNQHGSPRIQSARIDEITESTVRINGVPYSGWLHLMNIDDGAGWTVDSVKTHIMSLANPGAAPIGDRAPLVAAVKDALNALATPLFLAQVRLAAAQESSKNAAKSLADAQRRIQTTDAALAAAQADVEALA